jgi:hypothetical protein
MKLRLTLLVTIVSLLMFTLSISCDKEGMADGKSNTGKGGSLARFTIAGDYLYAVDNHFLYAYSLANGGRPQKMFESALNFDIETVYAYNNNLFLGTRTGLYIYSLANGAKPQLIGEAKHARSCDPVVANDTVAFVTLKSGASCGPAISGLYIHDIRDIKKPVLKKTVELPDPVGLGLQDSILYVCCGREGLKVFNINQPYSPKLISTEKEANYVDVIPYYGTLICFVDDGMLLYDITNPAMPKRLNKLTNN